MVISEDSLLIASQAIVPEVPAKGLSASKDAFGFLTAGQRVLG